MISYVYYRSPLGWIEVRQTGPVVMSLRLAAKKPVHGPILPKNTALFRQLEAYFKKRKRAFSVALGVSGTAFQNRVWNALKSVPYGRTVSYGEIARRIGKKRSVRAVANAVGQNPWAIVVPCHRVIGTHGTLTGYAYGLRKKAWLLEHERD